MGCLSSKPKSSSGSSTPPPSSSSSGTKPVSDADKKGTIGDRTDGTIDEQYILGDELGASFSFTCYLRFCFRALTFVVFDSFSV